MPYLDESPLADEAGRAWQLALKTNLGMCLRPKHPSAQFKQLQEEYKIPSLELASILLRFRSPRCGSDRALIFEYASYFLEQKYIEASDLLFALLKHSRYGPAVTCLTNDESRTGIPSCEYRMFTLLLATEFPTSQKSALILCVAVFKWLEVISEYEMRLQVEQGGLRTVDTYISDIYESLGALAITVLGNKILQEFTQLRWWKDQRTKLIADMTNFDVHVLQWTSSSLAGRLGALVNTAPFIEIDKGGRPVWTDQQILAMVPVVPLVNSRAGLFVWLNAALTGRPTTDDMTLLSHLQARYAGDAQTSTMDLLVASFDVYTNAMLQREPRQNVKIIQSFICNKVPVVLAILAHTIPPPYTTESVIQMAFDHLISMDPLAPITAGSTDIRECLKTTRLEFLQACALHGLVTENAISGILHGQIALPRVTKYHKDSLVAQFSTNMGRLESLIDDLDGMQGNAGAIAACIAQIISNLCLSKDTMSLKTVCSELVKKMPSMDIVVQHVQPRMLLLPLCTLLNDWIHDQDQTECTPAYEEFSSILLFVLATTHRYDLDRSELGIPADSFVARLMGGLTSSWPLAELTSEQNSQLANWIEGLFAVDEHGETNGIGDEVMKQCSPQSFYLLVSTLFDQSMLACKSNALPMKTFKVGLELLLEPFLLPSLIMGLSWLARHTWEDHNDADIVLQVLEKLLRTASSSQDARDMHKAVLAIVAEPIYESLQELHRKRPGNKKAVESMDFLRSHLSQHRSLRCTKMQLEERNTAAGNMGASLQQTARSLVAWTLNSSNPPNPPPGYAHTDFAIACQLLDGDTLLQTVLATLQATPPENVPIAMDIWVAIMCSPVAMPMGGLQPFESPLTILKLRDTVLVKAANLQALVSWSAHEADAIIQLGQRIEAQLAIARLPAMPMQIPDQATDQATDQIMQDLGLSLNANATAPQLEAALGQNIDLANLEQQMDLSGDHELANLTAVDTSGMDMANAQMFGDMGLSMDPVQPDDQSMNMGNQDEDIFAGLDMGDLDDDFNFG